MSWVVACAVCLWLAVAVSVSNPAGRLARLRSTDASAGAPRRWLRGHAAAPAPGRRVLAAVGTAAAVWLVSATWWGLPAGLMVGAGVGVALGHVVGQDPTRSQLSRELPEALDLLAAAIEAGAPVSHAVDVVATASPPATSQVLGRVASHLALGRSATDVWHELASHPVWGDAALDLGRSERSGTPIEEALRIHADEARRRRQEAATARARSVGVKSMVPLMVCFLPAFLLVGVVPIIAGLLTSILG